MHSGERTIMKCKQTATNDRTSNSIMLTELIVLCCQLVREWCLSRSHIEDSRELWEQFQVQWGLIPPSEQPINTHRPQNLFNYVKVIEQQQNY